MNLSEAIFLEAINVTTYNKLLKRANTMNCFNSRWMGKKSVEKLYQNCIKWTCFEPTGCLNSVSMHWIADPGHNLPCLTDSPNQMWKLDSHVLSTHSCNDCDPSWLVVRVQDFNEVNKIFWIHFVAHLHQKYYC